MNAENTNYKGLAIILHSGSFDRIYHALSLALAALALGREVRLFVTYWALEYMRKENPAVFDLDKEAEDHLKILEGNLKNGHIHKISELITNTKAMGGKIFACTGSMGMLNISRDELIPEVDMSMGITTFLTETSLDQILFI